MDKEKAEGLVMSLLIYSYDTGYFTGTKVIDSSYYKQAMKRRNELKDEIINYLTGEEEDK